MMDQERFLYGNKTEQTDSSLGKGMPMSSRNRNMWSVFALLIFLLGFEQKDPSNEVAGRDGAPMVLVPAGEFWMGTSTDEVARLVNECLLDGAKEASCKEWFQSETPRHRVALNAFYLDKYEVSNQFFEKFVEATGYKTSAEREGKSYSYLDGKGLKIINLANWKQPEAELSVFLSNRLNHPIVSVSWEDAQAYCRWAGKRLPNEAEFEYATRGGTETRYWWGNGNPLSRRVANIADESIRGETKLIMQGYNDNYYRTAPIGAYEANPFGLYDMIGNTAEWVDDWYGKYDVSPISNPKGPSSGQGKIYRGGSWLDRPNFVRSAFRGALGPLPLSLRFPFVGFRCAQNADK